MARLDIEVTDKAKTDLAYKIIENSPYFRIAEVTEKYEVKNSTIVDERGEVIGGKHKEELISLRITADDLTEGECAEIMGLLDDECIDYFAHAGDTTLDNLMARKYVLYAMDDTATDFREFVRKGATNSTYPSKQEIEEWFKVRWPTFKAERAEERKGA